MGLLPIRVACAAVLLGSYASAAEHWIRLSTPHFEMVTTNSEKQGTAALKVFEQVRYFWIQKSTSKQPDNKPVRIIAFRSEKEFKPYRPNEGTFAFYIRGRKSDFIVMQDLESEHYSAALHEYTHLIVEHTGVDLPTWLNEGLADLYSTLEPHGNQAMVGRPIAGYGLILSSQKLIDLNTLFAVAPDSPYYNERNKMSIFYAESWALTHMLNLSQAYNSGFPKFLNAVASGTSSADAMHSVYGKTPAQLMTDLRDYLQHSSVNVSVYDVKLAKQDLEPDVSDLSEFGVELALADLLAANSHTSAEARQRLTALEVTHPGNPDVEESLGYLVWQQGDRDGAREHFKRAMDAGSKNGEMMFQYAMLAREAGVPDNEVIVVLQKAVDLKPDSADLWIELGMAQARLSQWGVALSSLSHLRSVKPARAFEYFYTLAYVQYRLQDPEDAKQMAMRAKKYASTAEQNLRIDDLVAGLEQVEAHTQVREAAASGPPLTSEPLDRSPSDVPGAPPIRRLERASDQPTVAIPGLLHVAGVISSFECVRSARRLHVKVDGSEMVFEIDDPGNVIVRNGGKNHVDMSCGSQKPVSVNLFYLPVEKRGADGMLREIVF